jgi:hypothetical protein
MKPAKRKTSKKKIPEAAMVERLYRSIHQEKRIVQRWVSGAEATVSTSAGGVIPITTLANAAVISSTPDFPSLAVLYTAYRCKAIRVQLIAFSPVPVYSGATVLSTPPAIAVFPWTSNTVPTTFQQALDVTGVKISPGYKSLVLSTSYKGDPDAHLWTGTGAAIGSNEQFGVSCIGTATAATASNPIWKVIPQYLCEFRMNG